MNNALTNWTIALFAATLLVLILSYLHYRETKKLTSKLYEEQSNKI